MRGEPGPLPVEDLEHVLAHTADSWPALRGARIFFTGGSGFFGRWLLESFLRADARFELDARALVLTRSPDAFRRRLPHLAAERHLELLEGDVRDFPLPSEPLTHVVHAAGVTALFADPAERLRAFEADVEGTRRVLQAAVAGGARQFLLASSGAVYGRQPEGVEHIGEEDQGPLNPADLSSSYAEGKRAAEHLCCLFGKAHRIRVAIARGFAFVGPGLPLDGRYAAGNFLRDALERRPIRLAGDGSAVRSYLYAADLAIWLWTVLFKGEAGRPYNVGSENAVSVLQLAERVAAGWEGESPLPIERGAAGAGAPDRYVPSTHRARTELGLSEWIGLSEALQRTRRWYSGARRARS